MKILETLNNEETKPTEKLEAIAAFVGTVRSKYGNTESEIQTVKVNTTDGQVPISLLSNEEKVAVATGEIKEIIAMTTAVSENSEGSVWDRIFEGFVAVNPVLVNLNESTDSAY